MTIIGVIGGGHVSKEIGELAKDVGRRIAESGAVLLCGGRGGVMEKACKGAKEAGGLTVGILPTTDPDDANPYVDVRIPTGMGFARNAIIAVASDALIAIGGRYGTLSEIAHALNLGKRVIGLRTWSLEQIDESGENFIPAKDAEEAVRLAVREATKSSRLQPQGSGRST
ncbi:MAG: TIGR00725 family protein [Thermoplasmata archaeon]|nr:TIGR00725 family protein [Thermoplasmata archaeon]